MAVLLSEECASLCSICVSGSPVYSIEEFQKVRSCCCEKAGGTVKKKPELLH